MTKVREAKEDVKFVDAEQKEDAEESVLPFIYFNAVQVVNRFLEVFGDKNIVFDTKMKHFEEIFAPDVVVSTLKTQKILMSGQTVLLDSFARAVFHCSQPSRRVFITAPGNEDTSVSGDADSLCFDLHVAGTSPGLGDPKKDSCLLYRSQRSLITHIWGGVDKQQLASRAVLTLEDVMKSEIWICVTNILLSISGFRYLTADALHFQDYTNIETIG